MWGSRWSCCGSAGTGSRPLRRLPANHGTGCCLAPGFLCDQRLQSYACLGRESRGKPQDVGVVTGSRPRSGGIETGKNLQSAPSRQDFHSRICPLPAERCGKTFARDGDDPPSPGSGFPTPRCGETGPPPPRPVSGSTRFSSCPKRLAPASTWLSPVATLSGPRSKGSPRGPDLGARGPDLGPKGRDLGARGSDLGARGRDRGRDGSDLVVSYFEIGPLNRPIPA